jgi:3D (Asp-Asp-Asp) domain-containing protein
VRQSRLWSKPSQFVLVPPGADAQHRDPAMVTVRAGQLVADVPLEGPSVAGGLHSSAHLYEGDHLWPPEDQPLHSGASVWLDRSVPFTLVRGSERMDLRGHGGTIGEALASVGVYLVGRDYTVPDASEPLRPYQTISIHRVNEYLRIEQETTSFETRWEGDPELEIDQTRMVREGQEGVRLYRYRITEINGEEVERKLEDTWVQQEPQDRIMAYGTKVVVRTLDTPQGPVEYWRRIRVLVTSYSPSTAGPSPSASNFGITRSGKRATVGMIAVDPSVIPMGTRMYVPGYGMGSAEDTGSAIIGRHIDVCYDDHNLVHWRRWVDVYLLTPVPPESSIRYVLPNWPPER